MEDPGQGGSGSSAGKTGDRPSRDRTVECRVKVRAQTCRKRAADVPQTCRKRNNTDRYGLKPMWPLSRVSMYARTYRRRIFVSAWPISLIATASDTPPASGSVAAPCRSPWKVIPANPCVAANLRQPVENDARSQGPRSRCRRRAPGAVRSRVTSWLGQRGGAGVPSSRRPGARDPARRLTTLADRRWISPAA